MGVLAALPMLVWLRGFMVDDALVTARYAANLAAGAGYVMNPGEPATDGVTPLGWAFVLAPFARGDEPGLGAFEAAKLLGAGAWLGGAALLGVAVGRLGGAKTRYLALGLVLCSAPLGAWALAGMETGVVLALGSVAVAARAIGREGLVLGAVSLVAWLRPELVPWALTLALAPESRAFIDTGQLRRRAVRAMTVLGVVASAAAVRWLAFGAALPLSSRAKAPDLTLGENYAVACFLLGGALVALAWRRLAPWVRGVTVAVLVHHVAVALAGGDWMPLSRLVVPALPGAVLVSAAALSLARPWLALGRLALALAGEVFAASRAGPAASRVGAKRLAVVREVGESLRGRTVATVDAGWVGLRAARVVDLAGITDPAVAALPGGHTSRAIPRGFLEARGVDALVLLVATGQSLGESLAVTPFARVTERRIARLPGVEEEYCKVAESTDPHYVVLHRCDR
jgi:hypothetical protein